ncbi:Qc-snare protein, Syn8/Syntaxin8-family [Dunaliella salina]|uniref:Qc-snare protein, Syn8/Syntaxin8-family n=1 Tax=Dunaliella salina TaxID=3046 RepID=A0ABQ7GKE7_DUNSA|nr:Qc-snare protein, Syn8/Syntaxin8-family [Dunaliella salina]|eukprot:KAF5835074.1 Qc-snare protein, Syn8/Syntaxin8-family [Dunaliella salina]
MPSGFRVDTDSWLREFEEAKLLEQEVLQLIQERNSRNAGPGDPETSRKTATARRKIGTLGTLVEKLLRLLDSPDVSQLSEQERNRRRDLLYNLRNRREQMQHSLRRGRGPADKESLMEGSGSSTQPPQETEQTAELDNKGLLAMQQRTMDHQDEELGHIEKGVHSTKHIALAIGEEADLHTRLLDDLDEEVDVTQSRMKVATHKVKHMMKESASWRGGLCIFLLIVTLVTIFILAAKLGKLFL